MCLEQHMDMIDIMFPFLYDDMVVFSHILKDFSEPVRDDVTQNTPAVLHDQYQVIMEFEDRMIICL